MKPDEPNQIEEERRRLADFAFLLNVTVAPDASPEVIHELIAVARRLGLDDVEYEARRRES